MYLYAQPHWYKAVKSSFKMLWIHFLALTTVEGVVQAAIDGLTLDQPVRKVSIHPCHLYITAQQISKNIIKISLKSQSDFFALPVLKMIIIAVLENKPTYRMSLFKSYWYWILIFFLFFFKYHVHVVPVLHVPVTVFNIFW